MPCLDMKDGRVIKGIHFEDIKDAGDSVENAKFYQSEGADEPAILDIAATLENCSTRLEWGKKVSTEISIPLTVGGGIGSIDDIEMVLGAGADKVSINSATVANPDLIKQAADILLAASVFHFRTFSIGQVKEYLQEQGIAVE